MKMWSGRFQEAADPEFDAWQRSLPYDCRLLPFEVAASKAHARAIAKAGVLTASELDAVIAGLDRIAGEEIAPEKLPQIEDIHHFVESRLVNVAGEVGLKLHTGRSRNEQIATDLRLYVRSTIDQLIDLVANLIEAAVVQAEAAGDAAMPSYTHLQRAEPVLVAHWLLAYAEMLLRDVNRLSSCRKRLNLCPLGSGAIAGAVLALDRAAVAAELGFDGPTANSMDATSDRDFAVEFAQAASLLAAHLSRWAEDLILYSTAEYGFVILPERYSTGSSAMPQKKNPDALELIRGKAGRIHGHATSLLVCLKGLPLAYNKDLQETQEPVFEVAEQILAMTKIAGRFMATLQFNLAQMTKAASGDYMNAFAAAGHLVSAQGVPFRRAHELIGSSVRKAIEKQCQLQHLSASDFEAIGICADSDFYRALSLEAVLAAHDVVGGTAPAHVRSAITKMKETISSLRKGTHACA